MKKRRRPSTGRLIIIGLLVILTLYGFLVGPLRALTNNILLGGLLNLLVAFALMAAFFYLTLRLAGPHVLPVNLRDKDEKAAAHDVLRRFATGSEGSSSRTSHGICLIPGSTRAMVIDERCAEPALRRHLHPTSTCS